MNQQTFRVAVVGCGAIAPCHVGGIQKAGCEVVALCDINPDAAKKLAEQFHLKVPIFEDYLKMLATVKPDVVHICTPHYLHAQMSVEALDRNIHVLCEKPIAISLEQLKAIEETTKKSKASLGVCFQNRYEPNILRLKRAVEESGLVSGFGDAVWHRDVSYYQSGAWRGKIATEGGGVMINQAHHMLDLMQWICGMPARVQSHVFNDHLGADYDVEDTAIANFFDENGTRLFQLYATTANCTDFPAHLRIRLKNGEILHADNSMFSSPSKTETELSKAEGKLVWGVGHALLISDFYTSIREGKHFPIDAEEAGKTLRLVLGMYQSNGADIAVPNLT